MQGIFRKTGSKNSILQCSLLLLCLHAGEKRPLLTRDRRLFS
jgi:hypothetical protein